MTDIIDIADYHDISSQYDDQNEFRRDIEAGFSPPKKHIKSKYFYDEKGSELFNQITRHPDYYLTSCELEILNRYANELSSIMGNTSFNVIELGPGEGIKTKILAQQFFKDHLKFRYTPIDISKKYLKTLMDQFKHQIPSLEVVPIHADYFKGVEWQSEHSSRCNLVLFLGSSIGNFDPVMTQGFLRQLWNVLHHNDYVLLGFDLKKDIELLMRAYDDSAGITRDFNLNLLTRINRELAGKFYLNQFRHHACYNANIGAMESYLVSTKSQDVPIESLRKTFSFKTDEFVHVECSYKYSLSQIDALASDNGFVVLNNFFDSKQYFVDSLWQVKK